MNNAIRRYHLTFAKISLIMAIINSFLAFTLNYPAIINPAKYGRVPLALILISTLGAILITAIILSWLKKHFHKELISSDYKKYGAIRGSLLPLLILLIASVATHLTAILFIFTSNSCSRLWLWPKIISWAEFYLYSLPLEIFLPLIAIFTVICALAEQRTYHKK